MTRELESTSAPEGRGTTSTTGPRVLAALFALGLLWGAREETQAGPPSKTTVAYGPSAVSAAVYPPQKLPIKFSHAVHIGKGMACVECHTEVTQSRKVEDWNFPKGEVCDRCHTPQHPRPRGVLPRCQMCHTGLDAAMNVRGRIQAPPARLQFNHALHLDKGAACDACHRGLEKTGIATTAALPREEDCLTCHDGIKATSRCGACHPSEPTGRLQTTASLPAQLSALVPSLRSNWGAAHDLAFVQDHTAEAKANPKLCESCHDEGFCTACHAGSVRPLRLHPADYLTTHALDARGRVLDCDACHRTTTFCLGCHQRLGFGDRDGVFGVGSSLRFHPEGWSGPPGLPQTHGIAAQRNLSTCVSCHDEQSCLACHAGTTVASPGLGVSPHGSGFRGSARCTALANRSRRMCLQCHPPGDPQLECR